MAILVILRGLPGCGKSTYARQWVSEDPEKRAEVNRDAIRLMLGGYAVGTPAQEKMVTKVQHQAIKDLLKSGVDVISSDTNIAMKYMRELYKIANAVGADIIVKDMTDVPLDLVMSRNANRKDKEPVPISVIHRMSQSVRKQGGYPLPLPDEDSAGKRPDFYYGAAGLPLADICDIDGTVASCAGVRSPYDYSRVLYDRPRVQVINMLYDRCNAGKKLIFMSGRPDINNVRADTEKWLDTYLWGLPYEFLAMRPADMQQLNDAVVKRHLFDTQVRDKYNISLVFDDRDRVVDMWRNGLGLDCLQVNYGDF